MPNVDVVGQILTSHFTTRLYASLRACGNLQADTCRMPANLLYCVCVNSALLFAFTKLAYLCGPLNTYIAVHVYVDSLLAGKRIPNIQPVSYYHIRLAMLSHYITVVNLYGIIYSNRICVLTLNYRILCMTFVTFLSHRVYLRLPHLSAYWPLWQYIN
jgi:hypothetical protein